MAIPTTTILVEDLRALAAALPPEARFPALERVLSRGRKHRSVSASPNHLRFDLFGIEPPEHLPVAALTHLSFHGELPPGPEYWLRADPVSLRADMTRVFMTACGFADYDASERDGVGKVLAYALSSVGIELPAMSGDCWCFPLLQPLPFAFTPLHAALGIDLAEVLPAHPEAASWKRVLTEIQVELHQGEINSGRRAEGRPEVNSVWFWGGGRLPENVGRCFDSVCSNDPVSRGLALLSDSELRSRDEAPGGTGRVLVDWTVTTADPVREAAALEQAIASLLDTPSGGGLRLIDGSGAAWDYGGLSARRFWARPRPLAQLFGVGADNV